LLSALAEAPDFAAGASFLTTQLVEVTGAPRACLFRLDVARESLTMVAAVGFGDASPEISLPLGDLSSPLVISALSLSPVRGTGALGPRQLDTIRNWTTLPLSQPRFRGAPETMSADRAAELIGSDHVTVVTSGE